MKRDSYIFVAHGLSCIEDVLCFSKDIRKAEFKRDEILQNAIIRKIEMLGEACNNIPNSFRKQYPSIPWNKIVATRNKLIHQYFGVDLDLIWDIVKIELPKLQRQFEEILNLRL